MSLFERLENKKNSASQSEGFEASQGQQDAYLDLKKSIHNEVINIINKQFSEGEQSKNMNAKPLQDDVIRALIQNCLDKLGGIVNDSAKEKIVNELFDDITGLGPLEPLLADDSVTEIMVNGPQQVYIERKGKIELSEVRFRDEEHIYNIIDRVVSNIGRRIDEASPIVDARLSDGSRVNSIIPPVSIKGPIITIRKFARKPITVNDLVRLGTLSERMAAFLEGCVKGRVNIIVSGGTGSGKTTLLNALSAFIPDNERIITIEDAAELQLRQMHVVTLESRPPNLEGNGEVSIRDLVRNALRMRPDRIIVGEVRSGEAFDMLQAMNTGHDGSLTTAHANSPHDLLTRLESMILMSGINIPVKAIREQIASAIHIIVQQERLVDGTRKIVNISEIKEIDDDMIRLTELFIFENDGFDSDRKLKGRFISKKIKPKCLERINSNGVTISDDCFIN